MAHPDQKRENIDKDSPRETNSEQESSLKQIIKPISAVISGIRKAVSGVFNSISDVGKKVVSKGWELAKERLLPGWLVSPGILSGGTPSVSDETSLNPPSPPEAPKKPLLEWLREQQASSTMNVKRIPLESVGQPWGMHDGDFKRDDGNFFGLTGAEITNAGREVKTWNQPMLEELGDKGVVALIQDKSTGDILVTARAEPGNKAPGRVLLGPSFQASSANFQQAHGGKKPPLAEILEMNGISAQADQPQDGGRYFEKVVNTRTIETANKEAIQQFITPDQQWATLSELDEAVQRGFCNSHLRDALLMCITKKVG